MSNRTESEGAIIPSSRRSGRNEARAQSLHIEGSVSDGFERVRDAFVDNFTRRGELGAACCVYQNGEKVVDLWGGLRDRDSGELWGEDTMTIVHSTTKGLAAMVMALAHSRGWLDYEARVATYWPEFAQNGKEEITVRQLLAHQAGLFGFDESVDRAVIADLDRLAGVMARQRPAWPPGERQAYHAISLGFYESELIRRVDPAHRTLGQVFADEIARPLGIEFYIRVPESIPDRRIAPLEPPSSTFRFGHPRAFGAPGAGGSMGYADPEVGIGYGYVTNRMGTNLQGDPRDIALREALAPQSFDRTS